VTQAIDKEFVFDPLGRLVLVKVAGVVVESLHYDGDGRLARVNQHDTNGYTPSVFVYEGEQISSSWTNSGSWSRDWQAVWGPGQDELLEFHDFNAGRTLRVIPDHRNSIAALIDESTGQVHSMARYTPEGLMRVLEPDGSVLCDERASLDTSCTLPIPFGFNGMWRSEQSGLSYMRNRWYSPQLAQFMSHDPLEYIDSFNLYAFATLDPINFWDPWGLDSQGLAGGAGAGASSGVAPPQRVPRTGGPPSTNTGGCTMSRCNNVRDLSTLTAGQNVNAERVKVDRHLLQPIEEAQNPRDEVSGEIIRLRDGTLITIIIPRNVQMRIDPTLQPNQSLPPPAVRLYVTALFYRLDPLRPVPDRIAYFHSPLDFKPGWERSVLVHKFRRKRGQSCSCIGTDCRCK